MGKFSTRGLSGIGLMLVATAVLGSGLMPGLRNANLLLAGAALLLTLGTYLVGTDVSGRIV
ncbi:MAG: hypothetical protein ABEJ74_00780 [Haloferacaceae archaeon]